MNNIYIKNPKQAGYFMFMGSYPIDSKVDENDGKIIFVFRDDYNLRELMKQWNLRKLKIIMKR